MKGHKINNTKKKEIKGEHKEKKKKLNRVYNFFFNL